MSRPLVLLTLFEGAPLRRILDVFVRANAAPTVVRTLGEAEHALGAGGSVLFSFGAGVVVPERALALCRAAYNVHAASPDFPGRDPHHFAVWRGATTYGATLHVMTPAVDQGPIVAVERFPVGPDATPDSLLAAANEAGMRLVERYGAAAAAAALAPDPGLVWSGPVARRRDFERMATVSPLADEADFDRRRRAVAREGYDNLRIRLFGETFLLRPTEPASRADRDDDFTEEGFRRLLAALAAGGYGFARFGKDAGGERQVLWRHDVDFSVHRAAKLAAIEKEAGAVATYFLNPRSPFYNLLETGVRERVDAIRDAGHDLGLHFDVAPPAAQGWTRETLAAAVARERRLLEEIVGAPVVAVSWHNPELGGLLSFDDDEIGGLVSAYGRSLRSECVYASDSNGYWRFRPMAEVIAEGRPRLHLLTHPEWWTPEAAPPAERIERAIIGRARATWRDYVEILQRSGRENRTE